MGVEPTGAGIADARTVLKTVPGLFTTVHAGPAPDLQFHTAPVLFEDHGVRGATEHGFSMGPTLVRPRSRGRLWLRSADPTEAPAFDPRYLSEPEDVATLVADDAP